MILVSLVGKVVEGKQQRGGRASFHLQVGACGDIQQRIARCAGLCVIQLQVVVLFEASLCLERHESVVQQLAVTHVVVAKLAVPAWGGCERQVFAVFAAMGALCVDD